MNLGAESRDEVLQGLGSSSSTLQGARAPITAAELLRAYADHFCTCLCSTISPAEGTRRPLLAIAWNVDTNALMGSERERPRIRDKINQMSTADQCFFTNLSAAVTR